MATSTWIEQPEQLGVIAKRLKIKNKQNITGVSIWMETPCMWAHAGFYSLVKNVVTVEYKNGSSKQIEVDGDTILQIQHQMFGLGR